MEGPSEVDVLTDVLAQRPAGSPPLRLDRLSTRRMEAIVRDSVNLKPILALPARFVFVGKSVVVRQLQLRSCCFVHDDPNVGMKL